MKNTVKQILIQIFVIPHINASYFFRPDSAQYPSYIGTNYTTEEICPAKISLLDYDLQYKAHLAYVNRYHPYYNVFMPNQCLLSSQTVGNCRMCSNLSLFPNTNTSNSSYFTARYECPDCEHTNIITTSRIDSVPQISTNEGICNDEVLLCDVDNIANTNDLGGKLKIPQQNEILSERSKDDRSIMTVPTAVGQSNTTAKKTLEQEINFKCKKLTEYYKNKIKTAKNPSHFFKMNKPNYKHTIKKKKLNKNKTNISKNTPIDKGIKSKTNLNACDYIGNSLVLLDSIKLKFINNKITELVGDEMQHGYRVEKIIIKFMNDPDYKIYRNDDLFIYFQQNRKFNKAYGFLKNNIKNSKKIFNSYTYNHKTNQYNIKTFLNEVFDFGKMDVTALKKYIVSDEYSFSLFINALKNYGISMNDSGKSIAKIIQSGEISYKNLYLAIQNNINMEIIISKEIIENLISDTLKLLTLEAQILFLFPQFHALLQYIEINENFHFKFCEKKELGTYICFLEILKLLVKLDWILFSKEIKDELKKNFSDINASETLNNVKVYQNSTNTEQLIRYKQKYLIRIKNEMHQIICFLLYPFLKQSIFEKYVVINAYEIVYYIKFFSVINNTTETKLTSASKHFFGALSRTFFSIEICKIKNQRFIENMYEKYIQKGKNKLNDNNITKKTSINEKIDNEISETMFDGEKINLNAIDDFNLQKNRLQVFDTKVNRMFCITRIDCAFSKNSFDKNYLTENRHKSLINVFLHYLYCIRHDEKYTEITLYNEKYASKFTTGNFDFYNFFNQTKSNKKSEERETNVRFVNNILWIFQNAVPFYI